MGFPRSRALFTLGKGGSIADRGSDADLISGCVSVI
ncbi:hypothetical protein Pcac1_g20859 [Phytophthora cactorum]|nr:hypothetical protein Pcac1_g20859 [Phytophthora cactorum]